MLTIFSTPKPFHGHISIIQRNAIRSWRRLHPEVEILLFGDDAGTAEVCEEFGISHARHVEKNRFGTKYLASIYDQAQELACHDFLCHVNCDILLFSDFRTAVEAVLRQHSRFLMAGRRWDVDIQQEWDLTGADDGERLRRIAREANRQRPAQWIDYFVFRKGLYYRTIPSFVIGRPGWDNWLLWHARSSGVPVIDASEVVLAAHQNHDYSYHPAGEKGVWEGEEAHENYRLLDGNRRFRTLDDADYLLGPEGTRRNYWRWTGPAKRGLQRTRSLGWFWLLDATRPARHRVGLRKAVTATSRRIQE